MPTIENSIENADSLEFCAQVVRVQAVRLNAIKTKHPWNSQYQKPWCIRSRIRKPHWLLESKIKSSAHVYEWRSPEM